MTLGDLFLAWLKFLEKIGAIYKDGNTYKAKSWWTAVCLTVVCFGAIALAWALNKLKDAILRRLM